MDIKSVLDERVIDLNMTAKNKKEAIEHLAGKLKDAGYYNMNNYMKYHRRYIFKRITGTDRNWTLCGNSSWEK